MPWDLRWRGPKLWAPPEEDSSAIRPEYERLWEHRVGLYPRSGIIVSLATVVLFVGSGLFFLVELMAIALATAAGFGGRMLFRLPWYVDARLIKNGSFGHLAWRVTGLRRSREVVRVVTEQIRRGGGLPIVSDGTIVRAAGERPSIGP